MEEILDWTKIPEGTVLGKITFGKSFRKGPKNSIHYEYTCSCGTKSAAAIMSIKRGQKKCHKCSIRESHKRLIHGFSRTRLHNIWWAMHQRCYNPRAKRFNTWGGRGIKICEEWKKDFLAFRKWALENGYQDNLTIDRIDNDGNYEPSNCRWATNKEQCNNTRNTIRLTIDGVTKTLIDWEKESPVSRSTIRQRVQRYGVSPKEAVFTPHIPVTERKFKDNRFNKTK